MSELVSVIISNLFEKHLQKTVDDLQVKADGPIEIIVKDDDDSKGMRFHLNEAAAEAKGKFLFKVDAHCILTPHWDTILKTVCENYNDMAVCRIKEIDEATWTVRDKGFDFVTMNRDLSIIKCGEFTPDDPDTAETMASIGCGWMIHKERFFDLEQNWVALGRYGNLGAEWALKVWLSGGRLLVNRHVTCGHMFRIQGVSGALAPQQAQKRKLLGRIFIEGQGPHQCRTMNWLAEHFHKIDAEEAVTA